MIQEASMEKIKKIGILTGGGDCPGLNAVIRAVVKSAIFKYDLEIVGVIDGFTGLVEQKFRNLTLSEVSGILPRGGTILGTSNRSNPFKYLVNENGRKIYKDLSAQAISNALDQGIQALIVIGGDGTLKIAQEIGERGLPVVGIPKTIDNDLMATDTTFGFDTALVTATEAIDKIHTTAESHHRIMVIEVMGRNAGWIALESGIAGGGDIILIPEIPFKYENICEKIQERQRQGKSFSIVVVAEGAKPLGGEVVISRLVEDSTEPVRLGGIGYKVGSELEARMSIETRVTVLGHIQRGGSPSPFDRILGTRFGTTAVDVLMAKNFAHMVSLRSSKIVAVPLSTAVSHQRLVPPECDLIKSARAVGTSFGD
ncbi:MAG: 6-phosphofructokinase [Candidatus Tectomicrobia bacterium]|uniref:ATP-dependent 6-phosphofructokinase n=1 Tax=Tectimicrobiota bacterium TaxID=2528274 RepID=A0A933GL34_UNCTE|nr:6-phosphofructokinase [Candidatus Tectomicrobia bacterium]